MKINALNNRQGLESNTKLFNLYVQFGQLLKELREKNLPDSLVESINKDLNHLNSLDNTAPNLHRTIIKIQTGIIRLVEKEARFVPKNYYRNIWLPLGMAAIGLPIGVAFGTSLQNMGLLALGIPIGLVIGLAIGTSKDKKAMEEGKQLKTEIKY